MKAIIRTGIYHCDESSNNGLFAYGKQGFATLTVYKDGSSYVSFYGEDNEQPKLLYTKQIAEKNSAEYDLSTLPDSFSQTIQASIYTELFILLDDAIANLEKETTYK